VGGEVFCNPIWLSVTAPPGQAAAVTYFVGRRSKNFWQRVSDIIEGIYDRILETAHSLCRIPSKIDQKRVTVPRMSIYFDALQKTPLTSRVILPIL